MKITVELIRCEINPPGFFGSNALLTITIIPGCSSVLLFLGVFILKWMQVCMTLSKTPIKLCIIEVRLSDTLVVRRKGRELRNPLTFMIFSSSCNSYPYRGMRGWTSILSQRFQDLMSSTLTWMIMHSFSQRERENPLKAKSEEICAAILILYSSC